MALLFHGALRRSEVAAVLRWADVELADGDDDIATVRRSKTNQAGGHPDVRRLVGGCAAAVRRLRRRRTAPEPGDSVVGLGVDQVNRRFAAACAAAGLEGRRTSHGGRVGLAVELTARGAATHAVQLAGGWEDASMVVRYAASVATRDVHGFPAHAGMDPAESRIKTLHPSCIPSFCQRQPASWADPRASTNPNSAHTRRPTAARLFSASCATIRSRRACDSGPRRVCSIWFWCSMP